MAHDNAYGQWGLAVAMIAISLFFLAKYVPIRTRMEKRSGGALATFLVALFAEMYGFPLTIYSLSHFVGIKVPLDHISGHLLGDLISWSGLGNGWLIVMILSNLVLIAGIWLISASWQRVYDAQGDAGHRWTLSLHAPSAVHRNLHHYTGLSCSVAHLANPGVVALRDYDVRQSRSTGGK